ncbi:hypothetical protein [Paraburkholderia translucens]|nr:hypothetical protein [Paraburkholderia sp. MMS20-SJTN17]
MNFYRDPVKTFIDTPHLMSDGERHSGYALLKRYHLSLGLQIYCT